MLCEAAPGKWPTLYQEVKSQSVKELALCEDRQFMLSSADGIISSILIIDAWPEAPGRHSSADGRILLFTFCQYRQRCYTCTVTTPVNDLASHSCIFSYTTKLIRLHQDTMSLRSVYPWYLDRSMYKSYNSRMKNNKK